MLVCAFFRSKSEGSGRANHAVPLKVLVTHSRDLRFDIRGGDMFVYSNMFAMLELGWHVSYIFYISDATYTDFQDSRTKLEDIGIKVYGPIPLSKHFLRYFLHIEQFDAVFHNLWMDLGLLSFASDINSAIYSLNLPTRIVSIAHDELGLRNSEEGGAHAHLYAEFEDTLFPHSDLIVAVSEGMASKFRHKFSEARSAQITFTYDYTASKDEPMQIPGERHGLVFIAGDNMANRIALKFMCQVLRAKLNDADQVLRVFGTIVIPEECLHLRNVMTHGIVSEEVLASAISRARWLLSPCFASVGVSTKFVKALSLGTPAITTKECTRDMPESDTEEFPAVILNPEDLAKRFMDLITDDTLWIKKNSQALPYYTKYFGKSLVKEKLSAIHMHLSLNRTKRVRHASSNKLLVHVDHSPADARLGAHRLAAEACHYLTPGTFERLMIALRSNDDWSACIFASHQSSVQVFSSELPKDVHNSLVHTASQSDYVWTPSARSTDILMTAGLEPRKLRSVPVFPAICVPGKNAKLSPIAKQSSPQTFVTFRFDTTQTNEQQLRLVLDAWCSAFQRDADVTLVITCDTVQMQWVAQMISSVSSTCARMALLHRGTKNASQANEDVYLILFPAQNQFADVLTALQKEAIVIYTECGGPKELLSTEYAVKVTSKFSFSARKSETMSCYLKRDSLVDGLRRVHGNMKRFKERARFGRAMACTHFSADKIDRHIRNVLLAAVQFEMHEQGEMTGQDAWADNPFISGVQKLKMLWTDANQV